MKSIDIIAFISLLVKYFHKMLKKPLTTFTSCYIIIADFTNSKNKEAI
nr:MAG TPA: hypothetical protein [Caudoviricetes sp.]